MASPNTIKLNKQRAKLRSGMVKDVTIDRSSGPNREERRRRVGKLVRRIARRREEDEKKARGIAREEEKQKVKKPQVEHRVKRMLGKVKQVFSPKRVQSRASRGQ